MVSGDTSVSCFPLPFLPRVFAMLTVNDECYVIVTNTDKQTK